jgi:hypothetical protein
MTSRASENPTGRLGAWVLPGLLLLLCAGAAAPAAQKSVTLDEARPLDFPRELVGMALGLTVPLGHHSLRTIPVLYGLYFSGTEGKTPRSFRLELETSTLTADLSTSLGRGFFATVELRGTYTSHNAAPYYCTEGRFDPDRSFNQSMAGGSAELGLWMGEKTQARLFTGAYRFFYSKYVGSSPYPRPVDHTRGALGMQLRFEDVSWFRSFSIKEGLLLDLETAYFRRDVWQAWGFEDLSLTRWPRSQEFGWIKARAGLYLKNSHWHNLLLDLRTGLIVDADRASAVRLGSMVGEVPVAGLAYGQLVADRYFFLHLEYNLGLWKGATLALGFDGGVYHDLEKRSYSAAGLFISLTQKTIMGLPISLAYGFCPLSVFQGDTSGGHEIYLIAKAAFWGKDEEEDS